MDDLDKFFTGQALAGLMAHAVLRDGDGSIDKVVSAAILVGRKTAAAVRLAAEDEATKPAPKPEKAPKKG